MPALRYTVVLLVLVCLAAPVARAATLNVPSQYATIQAAINAAVNGDTVLVADGTYTGPGNVDLDFGGRNITVTSQHGAASTLIDCGGYASSDGSGNHRGFYIHSGETSAVVSGFTVKNGYESVASNADSGYGGGVCIDGAGAIVQSCVITGNSASSYGGGVFNINSYSTSVTLTNCTITGNSASSGGGGVFNINSNSTGLITATNTVIYGDTGGEVYNDPATGMSATHCDVQGGYTGTANINADPLFVRNPNPSTNPPDYGDLHLKPGSPCIGAGTANGAPTTDKDGNLRPNPPSIGAYEAAGAPPSQARFDFNRDGHSDLLWHNTATGQVLVWDMNDQAILAPGGPFATVNPAWTVAAVADVNADGHPDLLWENTQTGQLLFWLMNGTQVLTYGSPFAQVSDTHWRVVSMADFNGDGKPDLLWENSSTGQLTVWYMNGTSVTTYGLPFATVANTAWQIAGTADFNTDGHPDLLWRNSQTGQVLAWDLGGTAGTTVLTYGSVFAAITDTRWRIVGTGDTNSDGHPDLVWANSGTGQVVRWLLGGTGGTQVQQYGSPFATVTDTRWQVVGVH